ncbi:MAG: LysR family transcriptional regulator [Phascolarctobacterium sp.]|uniref:LysR family transcriptional regulator n=1 Tax=Phascolarctobacterium sp. TaxID=2049039 RepID=UPI0026DDBA05|nr:LysR family transcriptional regulator [Phascolarctobacterium sp.]MDO4921416.1 LysR family transcriptional regulator [Phascolarctobacterium sp.]
MELRVLRYFLTVVREGGIVAAAETLHLTQPTLSRQLKELEEEVGAQLFIRGNKTQKIVLTDKGQLLRNRAEDLLALADKAWQELQEDESEISGTVQIGCGESDGMRLLAQAAQRLRLKYPDIKVDLYSGNAENVKERLDKGLLDFGLFIQPTNLQKYETLRLPVTDRWGVLVRRDSILAKRENLTAQDLQGLPLLVSSQETVLHNLQQWFQLQPDKLRIVGTYNLLFNAALLVEEGFGCAVCLDKLLVGVSDKLRFVPLSPQVEMDIDLAWRRYQPLSKAAAAFLKETRALCELVSV